MRAWRPEREVDVTDQRTSSSIASILWGTQSSSSYLSVVLLTYLSLQSPLSPKHPLCPMSCLFLSIYLGSLCPAAPVEPSKLCLLDLHPHLSDLSLASSWSSPP